LEDDVDDSSYIDGIFNYCDRWCERCPFTARCRTFAMEQEFERAEQEGRDPEDIDWDSFWTRVGLSFDNTPPEWLGEFDVDDGPEFDLGIDFEESTDAFERLLDEQADSHPLVERAHDYASATHRWLRDHAEGWASQPVDDPASAAGARLREDDVQIGDALAVVAWYHTLIATKLSRAVSGLIENEMRDEPWKQSLPEAAEVDEDIDEIIREANAHDAAGSGKVALISIERSIGAWTAIRAHHAELADSIAPLQRLLGWLRVTTDRLLPAARTFHRPGFDD
jgi:hypothetical protein